MNWTLLNTRPAHQAAALTEAARALGYRVLECPTLEIACLPFRLPRAEVWVFTSPNAVRCFHAQQPMLPRGRLIAIGPATAQALQALAGEGGPRLFSIPKNFTSENLLQMRVFDPQNAAAGQKVAIIKGEGGRTLLKETLQQRGWAVEDVIVYRRVRRSLCPAWRDFQQAERPLVLAMSVESVQALLPPLSPSERRWLQQQPVAALSPRIAEALREQGWTGPIHVAAQQDASGMIELLQQLAKEHT